MDKSNRPVGRQKRVGSGVGNVQRRGDGLSEKTEGPVGTPGGYSDVFDHIAQDQIDNQSANQSNIPDSSSGGSGGLPIGGSNLNKTGCSKNVIIFIVIAIALYFLYSYFTNKQKNLPDSSNTNTANFQANTSGENASYDTGAYAVSTSVSQLAREKYTTLKGNDQDTATIMVYVCGTDLETQDGAATSDIQEMLYAEFTDNVNIIMETGGTSKWQNNVISSKSNQRYRLTTEGLELLEENLGRRSMVNPSTLSDFIKFSKTKFPADRYFLIMWDHGAGSLTGYGYDQFFQNDSMSLDEISTALKNGNCKFDFIGFDACLMGTFETAVVLEPYADYMIASEEAEPGVGWHYTGWITALSQNISIPTTKLGKVLIDDYIQDVKSKIPQAQATLSLIDLAEFKGTVPSAFTKFASATKKLIDEEDYKTVSDAREGAKEFAPSTRINQIDLIHFAENIGTREAKNFAEIMRECIKYNRSSANITNANGISIFFPYDKLSMMSPILDTYEEIGMDEKYSDCIRSFASVTAGGQVVSSGSDNLLDSLLGNLTGSSGSSTSTGSNLVEQLLNQFLNSGDFSSITGILGGSADWLNIDQMKDSVQYYKKTLFDASALKITEKDGQKVLVLTENQWNLIHHMEMNVFIDDGKGFIDLGLDNVYEYNDDNDLIMEYDGTWLSLNGQIVSYYLISEDRYGETYTIRGRIPALLNSQLVDIVIVFNNENPYGMVLGAQKKYDTDRETNTIAKGLLKINAGDKIDFLCDYYTYDGKYSDTFYLGKQYTATGKWEIENLSVGNRKYLMTYRITDIYNNQFWTPSITE